MIITLENELEGVANSQVKHSFFIALETKANEDTTIKISNAKLSQYPKGWVNYRPFISDDGKSYYRVDGTLYDSSFVFAMPKGARYACWFPPYKLQGLECFINAQGKKLQYHNNMPYIHLGDKTKPCIVFMARQHPGETMSSFFLEGMLSKLFEMKLSQCQYSLLIIPIVNLSGAENNNHRLTPDGVDLNRSWDNNHPHTADIKQILRGFKRVAAVIDLHGDEVSKVNHAFKSKKNNNIFKTLFPDILFLPKQNWLKRFVKNLIHHHKIVFHFNEKTCQSYFSKQNIPATTVEFSAHTTEPNTLRDLGVKIAENLAALDFPTQST